MASLWGYVFKLDVGIEFAHQTFKWKNEAKDNAGVYCAIVGLSFKPHRGTLFTYSDINGDPSSVVVNEINGYLTEGKKGVYVLEASDALSITAKPLMFGNMPNDGGSLIIDASDYEKFAVDREVEPYIKKINWI